MCSIQSVEKHGFRTTLGAAALALTTLTMAAPEAQAQTAASQRNDKCMSVFQKNKGAIERLANGPNAGANIKRLMGSGGCSNALVSIQKRPAGSENQRIKWHVEASAPPFRIKISIGN